MSKCEELCIEVEAKGAKTSSKDLGQMAVVLRRLGPVGAAASAAIGALTLATIGLGKAANAVGNDIAATVNEVNELATASGLSAGLVNGLRLAASATKSELAEMVPLEFAKKMQDANLGSTTLAANFDAVGLSLADLAELDADEALLRTIDGLNAIPDSATKAAVSQELLGGASKKLMAALKDRGDLEALEDFGERWGLQVGPDAAAAASKWELAQAELGLAFEAVQAKLQPFLDQGADLVVSVIPKMIGVLAVLEDQVLTLADIFDRVSRGEFSALLEVNGLLGGSLEENIRRAKLSGDTAKDWAGSAGKLAKELSTQNTELKTGNVRLTNRADRQAALDEIELDRLKTLADMTARLRDVRAEIAGLEGDEIDIIRADLAVDLGKIDSEIEKLRALDEQTRESTDLIVGLQRLRMEKAREASNAIQAFAIDEANSLRENLLTDAVQVFFTDMVHFAGQAFDQLDEKQKKSPQEWVNGWATAAADVTATAATAANTIASNTQQLTDFLISQKDLETEKGRESAMKLFRAQKAANIAGIITSALAGASRQFVDLPWFLAIPAAASILGAGYANARQAGQQQPTFHGGGTRTGGGGPDEMLTNVRRDEAVMTPQGMQELVNRANGGALGGGGSVVIIQQDHRAVGAGIQQQLERRESNLTRAIRRSASRGLGKRRR